MAASALPAAVRAAAEKASAQKNVLDWLHTFAGVADPALRLRANQPKSWALSTATSGLRRISSWSRALW